MTGNAGVIQSFSKLGTVCPRCDRAAWFEFEPPVEASDTGGPPHKSACGGCGGTVRFYVVDRPSTRTKGWLWAHPSAQAPHETREHVAAALREVHPALGQAYEDAAGSLRDGRWSAAASEARRTLEGLVKHRLEAADVSTDDTLQKLIEQLAESVDLTRPLMDTAHTVRKGGNVGAHYDTERVATEPLARQMLELVEALVEYLELLPARVAALSKHLETPEVEAEEPTASGG